MSMQYPQQPPPGGGNAYDLKSADITSIYGSLCEEFGRVENSRQGMLQYVFAVTSLLGTASVFAGAITKNSVFNHFLTAVGVLGMISIFALLFGGCSWILNLTISYTNENLFNK